MSLKRQAMSGMKWTGISSLFISILQVIQLAVLAHYLAPSDFGLMAIVTVIVGFSALFMDFGISASIIHKKDPTHVQLSSLYWLNIASGAILLLAVFFLAPFLAHFYGEVELISITRLLALTFVILAIGNQYNILLQKALKFNVIAIIAIISAVSSFIVAVGFAMAGFKVYSLVYASLTNALVSSTLNVLIGIKEHRPSLIYSHQEIKPMIYFGLFQMGEKSLNYLNTQLDVILIGKIFGTESLGFYSIAKTLSIKPLLIINPAITKVMFPVMSIVQNDVLRLKSIFLKTTNYLATITTPIYILIVILAEPIITVFFGDQWSEAIILLQILAAYRMFTAVMNPVGSLQLAMGRADMGFLWNLSLVFIIPPTILIGSNGGVIGIAYSLLGLQILLLIPSWYFMIRSLCGAEFKEYFLQIAKPLAFSILSGISIYVVSDIFHVEHAIINIALTTMEMGILVLLFNILFNRNFVNTTLDLLVNRKQH